MIDAQERVQHKARTREPEKWICLFEAQTPYVITCHKCGFYLLGIGGHFWRRCAVMPSKDVAETYGAEQEACESGRLRFVRAAKVEGGENG